MSDKKKQQLGMNPSTASNRLVKDILWKFIEESGEDVCFKCGEIMSREDFSIEHKEPWLDSDDPVKNFFDLENISFSHLNCNISAARRIKLTVEEKEKILEERKFRKREYMKSRYSYESRREKYLTTGH